MLETGPVQQTLPLKNMVINKQNQRLLTTNNKINKKNFKAQFTISQRWAVRKIVRKFRKLRKLRNLRCALCLFFPLLRNLRCALCLFFQRLRNLRCALCLFFQRLRNLRLRIGKSNICCALIVNFFRRCAITK